MRYVLCMMSSPVLRTAPHLKPLIACGPCRKCNLDTQAVSPGVHLRERRGLIPNVTNAPLFAENSTIVTP